MPTIFVFDKVEESDSEKILPFQGFWKMVHLKMVVP